MLHEPIPTAPFIPSSFLLLRLEGQLIGTLHAPIPTTPRIVLRLGREHWLKLFRSLRMLG